MKLKIAGLSAIILFVASCVSLEDPDNILGLGQEYQSFVPARMGVLACQGWPERAKYDGILPTNANATDFSTICETYDRFILKSFTNQPLVKGFTPKLVRQYLEKSARPTLLQEFSGFWQTNENRTYQSPLVVYRHSVYQDNGWLKWLHDFSKATNYADAVLLPFVLHANEARVNDRGILLSTRSLKIALLLIDSNNGKIIWSGEEGSEYSNKEFSDYHASNYPEFPDWQLLFERVFSDRLWFKFPGILQEEKES